MAIDWTKIYKNYKGKWVALASDEKTILSTGKTVHEALTKAGKKSTQTPFLMRVPKSLAYYVG